MKIITWLPAIAFVLIYLTEQTAEANPGLGHFGKGKGKGKGGFGHGGYGKGKFGKGKGMIWGGNGDNGDNGGNRRDYGGDNTVITDRSKTIEQENERQRQREREEQDRQRKSFEEQNKKKFKEVDDVIRNLRKKIEESKNTDKQTEKSRVELINYDKNDKVVKQLQDLRKEFDNLKNTKETSETTIFKTGSDKSSIESIEVFVKDVFETCKKSSDYAEVENYRSSITKIMDLLKRLSTKMSETNSEDNKNLQALKDVLMKRVQSNIKKFMNYCMEDTSSSTVAEKKEFVFNGPDVVNQTDMYESYVSKMSNMLDTMNNLAKKLAESKNEDTSSMKKMIETLMKRLDTVSQKGDIKVVTSTTTQTMYSTISSSNTVYSTPYVATVTVYEAAPRETVISSGNSTMYNLPNMSSMVDLMNRMTQKFAESSVPDSSSMKSMFEMLMRRLQTVSENNNVQVVSTTTTQTLYSTISSSNTVYTTPYVATVTVYSTLPRETVTVPSNFRVVTVMSNATMTTTVTQGTSTYLTTYVQPTPVTSTVYYNNTMNQTATVQTVTRTDVATMTSATTVYQTSTSSGSTYVTSTVTQVPYVVTSTVVATVPVYPTPIVGSNSTYTQYYTAYSTVTAAFNTSTQTVYSTIPQSVSTVVGEAETVTVTATTTPYQCGSYLTVEYPTYTINNTYVGNGTLFTSAFVTRIPVTKTLPMTNCVMSTTTVVSSTQSVMTIYSAVKTANTVKHNTYVTTVPYYKTVTVQTLVPNATIMIPYPTSTPCHTSTARSTPTYATPVVAGSSNTDPYNQQQAPDGLMAAKSSASFIQTSSVSAFVVMAVAALLTF